MGNTTNSFLRDGAYVTDPVLVDSGSVYTPGISERRGTKTTYLHSGLKNAFAQSDTSQVVAATREYDAFGNVTSHAGAWEGPFGYAGTFGYQSASIPGASTPDAGLQLLGHRYYDPSTGRFLTRDPIFDGRNWYSYGGGEGNPLTQADPTGLVKIILFWYEVVGGGHHASIIIIDNVGGGPSWSFSGGPEKGPGAGSLIGQSGMVGTSGVQDSGKYKGGGIVLVDNDEPIGQWIDKFLDAESAMSETSIRYRWLPSGRERDGGLLFGEWVKTGNSNSWAHELLERTNLLDEFQIGLRKRERAGHRTPWLPGWGVDPWGD